MGFTLVKITLIFVLSLHLNVEFYTSFDEKQFANIFNVKTLGIV